MWEKSYVVKGKIIETKTQKAAYNYIKQKNNKNIYIGPI